MYAEFPCTNIAASLWNARAVCAVCRCVSGCTCEPKVYDALHEPRVSQLYIAELRATQHLNCTITITVLPTTSSGKHKFKVRVNVARPCAHTPMCSAVGSLTGTCCYLLLALTSNAINLAY